MRTVQFGDGYEQRQRLFLRPKKQKWEIKIVGEKALIEQIKAFLDSRGGVEAFYWQRRNGEKLLVKAAEYTETPKGGRVYLLETTFEEVWA